MRKLIAVAAVLVLAGFTYGAAQFNALPLYSGAGNYEPFGRTLATDKTVIGLIKYTGSEASGTIDLNAGTIELNDGDLAGEVVDTDADDGGCDVEDCGDLANAACGVATGIDLAANAACDTWGEVADIINCTKNWQFVLIDVLRQERVIATGASMLDPTDAQAKLVGGYQMLADVSEGDSHSLALIPGEGAGPKSGAGDVYANIDIWLSNAGEPYPEGIFSGVRTFLSYWTYAYDDADNDDATADIYCQEQGGDWTERLLYQYPAAADDTTYNKDWTRIPVGCRLGEKMILRTYSTNTAAAANTFNYALGFFIRGN